MPTRWETFPIPLQGGLMTNKGRIDQGIQFPGSATLLQNFEVDVRGGYTRILGYQKFSNTEVPGSGKIEGIVPISETEVLVTRGNKFQFSGGTSWTEKGTIASTPTSKLHHSSYNFTGNPTSVIVDGVNPPVYFDHVTKTLTHSTSAPPEVVGASWVSVFKSHLFFGKGRLLSFSSPYLQNNFQPSHGAGVINVGDDITGLVVYRDQLIVFCTNRIFRLSGNTLSDFALSPITDNTGCISGHTIQEVGSDILYLAADGIRYLSASERDNDFGLTRASANIQSLVVERLTSGGIFSSVTIPSKNQYRIFNYEEEVATTASLGFIATKFSDQSSQDLQWSTAKGIKVYALSSFQGTEGGAVFFSSNTGFVYRMESGNSFDGVDIECLLETPYMPITDPKFRKTFYKHTLFAKPTGPFNLTCQLRFDYGQTGSSPGGPFPISGGGGVAVYGDPSSVYGVSVYEGASEEQFYNNTVGSGFVVALRYSNRSSDPPFNINFVVLEYRQNERR